MRIITSVEISPEKDDKLLASNAKFGQVLRLLLVPMFRVPHLRAGPAAVDGLDGIPSGESISVYFAPECQRWINSENIVSLAGSDL